MRRRTLLGIGAVAMAFPRTSWSQSPLTLDEARAIARDAYIYTYPMVENYLSIYQFALDPQGSQYKGPPNAIHNVARVFTPEDRGVVTLNSDTPYSFLVMDLRAEPLVVTLPAIEADRYYSLQLVDLFTQNADYIGTRKDGNDGGDFLIVGPGWEGDVPPGISRAVRMPTELVFSQFRTQLKDSGDIERVKVIQSGYSVRPLSAYAGTPPPEPAPTVDWPAISRETAQPGFWSYANFLLQFAPPLPWEADMRARFARIGVAPADAWPSSELSAEVRAAVADAGDAALAEISEGVMKLTSSRGLFGTPEEMRGKYFERAMAAMGGLYGLEEEEALYETYMVDADGRRLDTSRNDYVMRFQRDELPPAGAFWSVTMYDGDRFLVDNRLDRYLINSSMLSELKENAEGEIVLYLQHESPGTELETNWLPAPDGLMGVVMRIYLPDEVALDGIWQAPPVEVARRR